MLLKRLTEAMGPSGFEDEVRDILREEVAPYVDRLQTDVLGNLLCETFGQRDVDAGAGGQRHDGGQATNPWPRILLDAHMDEVGLMITRVEDNGLLKFRQIGGIDPRVLISKPVRVGAAKHPGVIGLKPIHLQSAAERHSVPTEDQLFIDIGATNRDDALAVVQLGDAVMFATDFEPIGERCMKAKAFDDRIGCAVLVETLRKPRRLPLHAAFTVQEEVGLRGATVAAYRVQPDIAIALEGTVCADVTSAPGHVQGTKLGAGPALTVQDGRTIADGRFLDFLISVAEKHNIPYQLRRVKGGSNDFAAIQRSQGGVIGGGISIPVRYIHAPSQIASQDDYEHAIQLVDAVLSEIEAGGFSI